MSLITTNNLKWLSTVLILTGILLTNLNNYPVNIFIHGLGKKNVILHYLFDWTEGCIAVTNKEIKEIYGMVETGTVLYIYA